MSARSSKEFGISTAKNLARPSRNRREQAARRLAKRVAGRRPRCQSWCVKTQDICAGHGRGVAEFVQRHADKVTGVISGWDRLRLQGSLRSLYMPSVMKE